MLGRDHALSGAAAFAMIAPELHVTGVHLAAGTVLAAGAAVLPDIDHPDSTISRSFGYLTRGFAWAVEKVSGGHRHGTHSLAGIAVFAALSWAAVSWRAGGPCWHSPQCPSGFTQVRLASPWHLLPELAVLTLLYAAGLRCLRLGGHLCDLLGLVLAAATIWSGQDTATTPAGHVPLAVAVIALGCGMHIAGDELTHGGCPWLWPVSRHEFHLLPGPMQITTSKLAERAIVSPLLLMLLGLALARDTGIIRDLAAIHHSLRPSG